MDVADRSVRLDALPVPAPASPADNSTPPVVPPANTPSFADSLQRVQPRSSTTDAPRPNTRGQNDGSKYRAGNTDLTSAQPDGSSSASRTSANDNTPATNGPVQPHSTSAAAPASSTPPDANSPTAEATQDDIDATVESLVAGLTAVAPAAIQNVPPPVAIAVQPTPPAPVGLAKALQATTESTLPPVAANDVLPALPAIPQGLQAGLVSQTVDNSGTNATTSTNTAPTNSAPATAPVIAANTILQDTVANAPAPVKPAVTLPAATSMTDATTPVTTASTPVAPVTAPVTPVVTAAVSAPIPTPVVAIAPTPTPAPAKPAVTLPAAKSTTDATTPVTTVSTPVAPVTVPVTPAVTAAAEEPIDTKPADTKPASDAATEKTASLAGLTVPAVPIWNAHGATATNVINDKSSPDLTSISDALAVPAGYSPPSDLLGATAVDSTSAANANTAAPGTPSILQQIHPALQQAVAEDRQLTITLRPPELGAVRIDVTRQDGQLTARLQTDTASAHQLLSDHLPQLREMLQPMGVSADQVQVVRSDSQPSNTGTSGTQWDGQTDARNAGGRQESQQQRSPEPQLAEEPDRDDSSPANIRTRTALNLRI